MGNSASQQQQQQPPPSPQKQQQQKKGDGQQQQQQQQQQKKKGRGAGPGRGAASTEREPQKESKGKGSAVASGSRTDDQQAQPSQRGAPTQQPKPEAPAQSPQKAAQKKAQKTPAPEPTEPQQVPSTKSAKKKGVGGAAPAESRVEPAPSKQVQEPPVKDSSSSQPTSEGKAAGKGRGKKLAAKQSEPAKAPAAPTPTPQPETPEVPTPVKEPSAPQPEPTKTAGKGRGKKGATVDKTSEPPKAASPEPSKPAPKSAPSQEPPKPVKSTPKSAQTPIPEPAPVEPVASFQEKTSKDPPLPSPAKPAVKGKGKKGGGDSKAAGFTKATSPAQDVPKQAPKPSVAYSGPQLLIPRRPQGQCITRRAPLFEKKLIIEVNYLPINFKDFNLKIFHYDVEFKPDRPKNLYRPALRMLLDKYVPRRHPAFDGKKNMYAGGTKLGFPNGESVQDTVEVFDPERGKEAEFEITVKLVAQNLSLSKLAEYLKSGTSLSIPQDVIQGVDIALRNAPIMNPNFVPVGRSFFAIPKPDSQPTDLGNGFELWHGHYQSAIMSWKPYLNVDVANKAFPIAQSVISFIYNDMKEDPEKQLEQRAEYRLLRFLKGLKVDYKIQSNDPSGFTKRTYKVKDLGAPPNRHRFKPEKEGSREITVEQYFSDVKKITLKFPHLPTVVTSNQNFLPIEFCHISPNQAVMRKLDEKQTAQMVRSAAKGTDIRRARIFGTIGQSSFNNDPCAKEFGISLSTNFEKVEAHILKAPLIRYANVSSKNRLKIADKGNVPVRNGVWQTRGGEKFINSPGLVSWVIINTDRKIGPQQINNIVKNFKQVGDNIGIPVQEPREILNVGGSIRSEADFEREFRKFDKGTQILLVIMAPFGIDDIYSKIKRVAELKVGVLTQCLKAATCDFRKMNAMTAQNILLKINSKISGVNHSLAQSVLPTILREPVMIVGADVTHPAPGTDGLSIAAVAASHDSYAFKYNMLYRLQPGRQEMIERLQEMIEEQLRFFYQNCKCKPKRILYYRDGVSEGQFLQVLNIELRSIRAACKKLEDGYEPAVTFLVVQKRHHTRFFPTGPKDWDGEKNKNVMAGTLVDCTITHPTEVDFYLVSHQSIQGTARPTKYHLLWDDNKIDQDELEQLTYYLCHMFARCNRSVSYPAPTYYAHLAAFRARAWWDGQRYDSSNLTKEQETKGRIQDHIVKNAPMFFV